MSNKKKRTISKVFMVTFATIWTVALVLFLGALLHGCSALRIVRPNNEIILKITDASVMVVTDSGRGSGTAVAHRGEYTLVLTCAHVLDTNNPNQMQVVASYDTGYSKNFNAILEDADYKHDLALIVVQGYLPVLPIAAHDPSLYETLFIVGNPLGMPKTATTGLLSAKNIDSENGNVWLVSGGFVLYGISGGTITNSVGELVCVPQKVLVFHGTPLPQIGFCVPLPTIKRFLKPYRSDV